jgi:outer membrane immunogenic protein
LQIPQSVPSVKNKVLTGLAALTLLDISAEMAAAQNWNGAYIGGHLGYRWGHADHTGPGYTFPMGNAPPVTSPARDESSAPSGIIGGIHAGYNFLFHPNLLAGAEIDATAGSSDDSTTATLISTDGVTARRTSKLGWQATIRARFGYVSGPWLAYVTGGAAVTRVSWSEIITMAGPPSSLSVSTSDTRWGGAVGAGIERFWSPVVLVRMQYLYEDFGRLTVPLGGMTLTGTTSFTAHKLVFGASYKF